MKITSPECHIELDVDEARRNYFFKCQDFQEEVTDFFQHFKPKRNDKN